MEKLLDSYSQLGQDLWAMSILNKTNGYFIDIGACDGITHSNTYLLEKKYKWKGICIEANPETCAMLNSNRDCMCINALVDSSDNILKMLHCADEMSFVNNEYNTIDYDKLKLYLNGCNNSNSVKRLYRSVPMKTKTISTILKTYNAPFIIDYISIDVEGMEYDILRKFPFEDYHVNIITVEHNAPHIGPTLRNKIRELLLSNNFTFIKGNDDICNWGHAPIEDYYKNNNIIQTDSNKGTSVKITQYILDE